ncbi:YceI family protein [Angustibacter luteus]|uniref:YceI family protein n=1 Tax=Angustibacter luteus TaxID=658456 RepID=A0ABW1JFB5_9ACTN
MPSTDHVTTASGRTIDGLFPGVWTVDPVHSEVEFVARHLMVSKVRGRFSDFTGQITIGATLAECSVEASVRTASVETRDPARDEHLRSPDFFDVERHPEMTFRSTGVREDDGDFLLDGELALVGVTRPVTFVLEFNGAGPDLWDGVRAGFSAKAQISRKQWGLTWNEAIETGGVLVSDKVTIELEVQAVAPTA